MKIRLAFLAQSGILVRRINNVREKIIHQFHNLYTPSHTLFISKYLYFALKAMPLRVWKM